MIYLDYNATTPLDGRVKDSIKRVLDLFGNPSSAHSFGMQSKEVIENARVALSSLLKSKPREIIFTSGGTESNNLAILGTVARYQSGHIISSVIEHPAILHPLDHLRTKGFSVTYVPVLSNGCIDPGAVLHAIRKETVLITIMHANNETGVLQPVQEISAIAQDRGILFHSDAAQTVGKIDVDVRELGVDMLSIAAHKFYGPKGIGALFLKEGTPLCPIMYGASQEGGLSPGTENTIGIAGMGAAAELAASEMGERNVHVTMLRNHLLSGLMERMDGIAINGDLARCLPNTLNISIAGIMAHELVALLKDEVALSTGSACHSGMHDPSPVLSAMGVSAEKALSSIRLSIGKFTTMYDVEKSVEILSTAAAQLLE